MRTGLCRRCGREFLWARTAKGRAMPVDPEPRPDGNLATHRDLHGQLRVRVVTTDTPLESWERPGMPHAATCAPARPEPVGRTPGGALSLADARRRRANRERQAPR